MTYLMYIASWTNSERPNLPVEFHKDYPRYLVPTITINLSCPTRMVLYQNNMGLNDIMRNRIYNLSGLSLPRILMAQLVQGEPH